jgi:hypothetical protein
MKTIFVLAIFTSVLFLSSCYQKPKKLDDDNFKTITPQALDNRGESDIVSSYSKRSGNDLVQELFEEACTNDEKLGQLVKKIIGIEEIRRDSLLVYQRYLQNNSQYFGQAANYIAQINDTALKVQVQDLIRTLEAKQNARIGQHKLIADNIDNKASVLNDQLLVLKLVVTMPMIENYQRNKLPDIKSLRYVNAQYDSLIGLVKKQTKK